MVTSMVRTRQFHSLIDDVVDYSLVLFPKILLKMWCEILRWIWNLTLPTRLEYVRFGTLKQKH